MQERPKETIKNLKTRTSNSKQRKAEHIIAFCLQEYPNGNQYRVKTNKVKQLVRQACMETWEINSSNIESNVHGDQQTVYKILKYRVQRGNLLI